MNAKRMIASFCEKHHLPYVIFTTSEFF